MPFIDYDDRPVSIDEGSREVLLPHETGVSLTTRKHRDGYKNVSVANLVTKLSYFSDTIRTSSPGRSAQCPRSRCECTRRFHLGPSLTDYRAGLRAYT